jgi:antitoxin MazE
MKTTVQKWGNSYAIRIPKSFIKEVGLEYRTDVELTLEDGKLVIQPIKEELSLENLSLELRYNFPLSRKGKTSSCIRLFIETSSHG